MLLPRHVEYLQDVCQLQPCPQIGCQWLFIVMMKEGLDSRDLGSWKGNRIILSWCKTAVGYHGTAAWVLICCSGQNRWTPAEIFQLKTEDLSNLLQMTKAKSAKRSARQKSPTLCSISLGAMLVPMAPQPARFRGVRVKTSTGRPICGWSDRSLTCVFLEAKIGEIKVVLQHRVRDWLSAAHDLHTGTLDYTYYYRLSTTYVMCFSCMTAT